VTVFTISAIFAIFKIHITRRAGEPRFDMGQLGLLGARPVYAWRFIVDAPSRAGRALLSALCEAIALLGGVSARATRAFVRHR